MSVIYHRGLAGLEQLRPTWDRLFERCSNRVFYNDWRWHYALQKYLFPADLYYVLVERDGEPAALLPLQAVVKQQGPIRIRKLRSPWHVAVDLSDMLVADSCKDEPLLGAIVGKLRSHPPCAWDLLRLTQFTERSCLYRQAAMSSLPCNPIGHSAYVTRASSNLGEGLSKKQLKNVARHLRSAETDFGNCQFEMAVTPDELAASYETFLEVEKSGWKGGDGTKSAIALRPDAKLFYGEVLRLFGETTEATVNVLRLGQRPVAAQIGLKTNDRVNLLKIGFDETFRDYGPGGIALLKCLTEQPQQVCELNLVTSPPWSERWHFTREKKFAVDLYNHRPYARMIRMARNVRQTTRHVLNRLSQARKTEAETIE